MVKRRTLLTGQVFILIDWMLQHHPRGGNTGSSLQASAKVTGICFEPLNIDKYNITDVQQLKILYIIHTYKIFLS